MTLQTTDNKTVEVSTAVRAYIVRCYCNSMTTRDNNPSGKVKAKDIYGNEYEFDLTNCFEPIHEKYKCKAENKYRESLKYKYK